MFDCVVSYIGRIGSIFIFGFLLEFMFLAILSHFVSEKVVDTEFVFMTMMSWAMTGL